MHPPRKPPASEMTDLRRPGIQREVLPLSRHSDHRLFGSCRTEGADVRSVHHDKSVRRGTSGITEAWTRCQERRVWSCAKQIALARDRASALRRRNTVRASQRGSSNLTSPLLHFLLVHNFQVRNFMAFRRHETLQATLSGVATAIRGCRDDRATSEATAHRQRRSRRR